MRLKQANFWGLFLFQAQENVDSCCQRWFYSGKLLGDKVQIEDAHIQPGMLKNGIQVYLRFFFSLLKKIVSSISGYIVQVIVNKEHQSHNANS